MSGQTSCYDQLKRVSKRATRKAIDAGVRDILNERRRILAAIDAAPDMTEAEKEKLRFAASLKVGQDYNRMQSRAKRQNSVVKIIEREAIAEVEKTRKRR